MIKRIILFCSIVCLVGLGFGSVSQAATSTSTQTLNPSVDQIKQMITETAIKHGIPPEIMKGIAANETNFKQFNADGTPIKSQDGGVGVMQVTPSKISIPVDENKLETNIAYNIEIAAEVLDKKWDSSILPQINQHQKQNLEDWYFAIMAYNGTSKANDPALHPGQTYQDKVYQRIAGSSYIDWGNAATFFKFPSFDIRYIAGDNTMYFAPGKNYVTDTIHPSQQLYQTGDIVYVDPRDGGVNLHPNSIDNPNPTKLWPYTPLKIVGGPIESPNPNNDYVYYKVQGIKASGYVSSAYLDPGTSKLVFSDAGDDQRAAALAFLALKGFVKGYPDGTFHSDQNLERQHVAVILDNILNLHMPSDYKMKADDVSSTNPYYVQLEKAEFNGLMGSGGKMRPKQSLKRSQMAQVMYLAFKNDYSKPTTTHQFADENLIWNPDAVNTLYFNNITVSDPFHPNAPITRSQFALFLYRTLVKF